jgi:hypothetical protein
MRHEKYKITEDAIVKFVYSLGVQFYSIDFIEIEWFIESN